MALRPTTMRSLVGVNSRATQFPVKQAAASLNRSADVVDRLRQRTVEAVATNAARARELVDAAGDITTAAAVKTAAPNTIREPAAAIPPKVSEEGFSQCRRHDVERNWFGHRGQSGRRRGHFGVLPIGGCGELLAKLDQLRAAGGSGSTARRIVCPSAGGTEMGRGGAGLISLREMSASTGSSGRRANGDVPIRAAAKVDAKP